MHLSIHMTKRNSPRWMRSGAALAAALFIIAVLVLPAHSRAVPQKGKAPAAVPATNQAPAAPGAKPDERKAKEAYEAGLVAEKKQDWVAAFENYSDAVSAAPDNRKYLLRRELARG